MSEPGANARHRQGKRAARPKPPADQPAEVAPERTWPTYRPIEPDEAGTPGASAAQRSTPPASRPTPTEQTPWFSDAPAFKQEKAVPRTTPASSRYGQEPATRLSQTPLRSEPSRPIPTPVDAEPRRVGTPPEVGRPEAVRARPRNKAEEYGAEARATTGTSGLDPASRQPAATSRSDGQSDRYTQPDHYTQTDRYTPTDRSSRLGEQYAAQSEPHAQQAGSHVPQAERRGRTGGADNLGNGRVASGEDGAGRASAGGPPVRMSEPGSRARRGGDEPSSRQHEADGSPRSRVRRPLIATLAILLVGTPITFLLLHQPSGDLADGSIPFMDRSDDTYVTPSAKPVRVTTAPPAKPSSPVPPTGTPTTTPSESPSGTPSSSTTPTTTPTEKGTATVVPSQVPTSSGRATAGPTRSVETPGGTTSRPTTSRPTSKPTDPPSPPPKPDRDGQMTGQELELFDLIDSARQDKGCKPLGQDPGLTGGARADAQDRAEEGNVNSGGGSMAAAGGDDWSAREAFDRMMSRNSSTILNCGLTELGVGAKSERYCKSRPLLICLEYANRVAWVADFR